MPQNPSPLELYRTRRRAGILEEDAAQERAVQSLEELYQRIAQNAKTGAPGLFSRLGALTTGKKSEKQGLYIHGGVGRGKSMVMDLFYECLPDSLTARRVHFHAFMIEAHEYMHQQRKSGQSKGPDFLLPELAGHIASRAKILCFDEFHVTDVADASILSRLFTALFAQGVIVVATSNWEPARLYEGGLQREVFLPFIDLLQERLEIVHLDSSVDYRAECLQEEGSYFYPLGQNTHRRMDAVFKKLTGGVTPHKEEYFLKGRSITVERSAAGAARFTFAELCEQPHGAEDYLLLAENYRVIMIEGLPKMGYDRRNEVKRFMILIDVLYEHGTKLIISADVRPEKLYSGGDYAFEFKRTISRLMEMNSAGYLAR